MSKRVALYANSRPRVATYLPIARALRAAGHDYSLFCPKDAEPSAEEIRGFEDVRLTYTTKPEMKALQGYDLFVTSEAMHEFLPIEGISVAILHSLPDRTVLKTNYTSWLKSNPHISKFDYFFVAIRQNEAQWQAAKFTESLLPLNSNGKATNFIVVPGGYPKLEYLTSMFDQDRKLDCILYSPTLSQNSASEVVSHGAAIIRRIHDDFPEFTVVFRPYPTDDPKVAADIAVQTADLPRVVIDKTVTGLIWQRRCAAMVTDKSSVAISFALGSGRPSVFFATGSGGEQAGLRDEIIGFQAVGWEALKLALDRCMDAEKDWESVMADVRDRHLYNPLNAASYLAAHVDTFVNRESRSDWLVVPRALPG